MGASGGSSIGVTENAWGRPWEVWFAFGKSDSSYPLLVDWVKIPMNKIPSTRFLFVFVQCFLGGSFSLQVFPPAISFSSLGQLLPEPQMFNVSWRRWQQEIASQGSNRNCSLIIQKWCAWRWHERFKRMRCKDAVQIYAGSLSYSRYLHNRHSTTSVFPQMQYLIVIKDASDDNLKTINYSQKWDHYKQLVFGPFARFRTRAFGVFNYINAGQTFLNPFFVDLVGKHSSNFQGNLASYLQELSKVATCAPLGASWWRSEIFGHADIWKKVFSSRSENTQNDCH